MNNDQPVTNRRIILPAIWVFVLLNMLLRDVHEFFRAGLIEEIISGVVNGNQMTEELFLISGIVGQIPLLMVVLPHVLPYRIKRWANIIASLLYTAFMFVDPPRDLDDIWFFAVRLIALAVIIIVAYRWQPELTPSAT